MDRATIYDSEFYRRRRALTLHSARQILPLIQAFTPMNSVVDVGCGTGTWLSVAREFGAEQIVGYEGPWVQSEMLDDPNIELRSIQLSELSPESSVSFDLVISLEVAEHLPGEREADFVAALCRLGNVVLFSAAVPMQGGRKHLNEQWQSHWARLFAERNFVAIDCIRKHIWNDDNIPFYYRQNAILFVQRELLQRETSSAVQDTNTILDIVHPRLLRKIAEQERGAREAIRSIRSLPRLLFASLIRRLKARRDK